MIVKESVVDVACLMTKDSGENQRGSIFEPYIGLEFDKADEAREFYASYATRIGFKARVGQLYRSRTDGSVSSRRYVCSKEGFQFNSRIGCRAFVRVQRRDTGKWVIDHFVKKHNHDLEPDVANCSPIPEVKASTARNGSVNVSSRPRIKLHGELKDELSSPLGIINVKRLKKDVEQCAIEPHVGLEFNSADEVYQCYSAYGASAGFRVRIGQLFRSKNDGFITSRRFVCSKEGFQHASRLDCRAYLRIKRLDSRKWAVDRLGKEHNHDLDTEMDGQSSPFSPSKALMKDVKDGLISDNLFNTGKNSVKRDRENRIKADWYNGMFEYFQSRQAEDTAFFYAVQVLDGNCNSIFWADGRSRYSCSRFGDAVVLDTSYRQSNYGIPFATVVGINHHKQPVLLGSALIADESEESFTWLLQTWLRAMSGRQPLSMIADHDMSMQQAIAKVFPGTHHRFSLWQLRAKEQENLSLMDDGFSYEYEKCIYQSQTADEFDTSWNAFLSRYGLKENSWLKEMYEKRACWVPVYLRGSFFAGIPVCESIGSFFGSLLNAQTPFMEFVARYERGLERRREEERKKDFDTSNLQALLQTKDPIEDQCRKLYTLTIFKVFQNELLQSFSYLGFKIYEEGCLSRYLLRRSGNDIDKHVVTFSSLNVIVSCSCQMFEYEGILCRHVLRVFQIMDVREVPSRYILHRWTKNAEYGIVPDIESWSSSPEVRALMLWSLRETASRYIDAGVTSLEKYRLAYEILREGGRKKTLLASLSANG